MASGGWVGGCLVVVVVVCGGGGCRRGCVLPCVCAPEGCVLRGCASVCVCLANRRAGGLGASDPPPCTQHLTPAPNPPTLSRTPHPPTHPTPCCLGGRGGRWCATCGRCCPPPTHTRHPTHPPTCSQIGEVLCYLWALPPHREAWRRVAAQHPRVQVKVGVFLWLGGHASHLPARAAPTPPAPPHPHPACATPPHPTCPPPPSIPPFLPYSL